MATKELDNPAGRLHALLNAYQEIASNKRSVLDTWAEVFDTDTS